MLTLRQALKLACFAKAQVVAGAGGLEAVIRRVHVVDIPGLDYGDWGRGLLLFTAGYGFKDNPQEQAEFIPALARQGLVGVVFSTGWYFESVPEAMRAVADQHNFPILAVPPDVNFLSIIERLYVEIVNDQFALKERADDIHRRLTRIVLEGGDLQAVAETLANILERSVLFDSPAFEVLAHAEHGPVDESRRRAVAAGRTEPELVKRMIGHGFFVELQQKMKPMRLGVIPELGMTMERVVAPIIVGREIYGYIWIVAGDHPLTDLDELAIENTATVAALVLLKQQAVRETQQAQRGDFLTQLLSADEPDHLALERAHLVGYHFDRPHQALFIQTTSPVGTLSQLGARVENWLRQAGTWGLVVQRERGVALIIEAKANTTGQALAEKLAAEISTPAQALIVGVGRLEAGANAQGKSFRRSYTEAREAAEIGGRLGSKPRAVCFWELGVLGWLYHLPAEALASNSYLGIVQALAEHDRKSNSDLVRTLEAYLEHGGALAEAAEALSVHRNTLLYRVGRIEAITGIDLKDATQRMNVHVALKAYLLRR